MIKSVNIKKFKGMSKDQFGQWVIDVNNENILMQFMVEDTRVTTEAEENWPDMKLILNRRNAENNKWEEFEQSEVAEGTRKTKFYKNFYLPHNMSHFTEIKAQIADVKGGGKFIIGESVFTIGTLLGINNGILPVDLKKNNQTVGVLTIRGSRASRETNFFNFQLKGKNLVNFGVMNTLNPMLKLWRPKISPQQLQEIKDGKIDPASMGWTEWVTIWIGKAEGGSPTFEQSKMGCVYLCDGLWNLPLRVRKFDFSIFEKIFNPILGRTLQQQGRRRRGKIQGRILVQHAKNHGWN
jgi:hypothetical protein